MWPGPIALLLVFTLSSTSALTLDWSNRGYTKEDFFITLQHKGNLPDVTDLILRNNTFNSFLDCSTNLSKLETLDLSQNHLQRFFFLCKEEYNLQVLNVSHNRLEYIDDNAFNDRIPKLKILDVSWNKLAVVNETMLEYFKVLEYLSLANNPIGDGIHENAFWTLTALKHLDLSNVSAPSFSSQLFKTLTNLASLDLSWNPITTVPALPQSILELDLSGTRIFRLQDFYAPHLKELKLNYMPLMKTLHFIDFENATNLESLSVTGSKQLVELKFLPEVGQRLLPKLERLSINDCGLQTLGVELQPILQRIVVLKIENNPWKCDCQMAWLSSHNATRAISREMKCHIPLEQHDKLLSEIPNNDLDCEYNSAILYPVLWSCIAVLLVILLVASGFYLFRRPFSWDFRRRNRDTVTYTNVVESSNDLVRILAVSETTERTEE